MNREAQIDEAVELRDQTRRLLNRNARAIKHHERKLATLRGERNGLIRDADLFLSPREIAGLTDLSQTFVREVLKR